MSDAQGELPLAESEFDRAHRAPEPYERGHAESRARLDELVGDGIDASTDVKRLLGVIKAAKETLGAAVTLKLVAMRGLGQVLHPLEEDEKAAVLEIVSCRPTRRSRRKVTP